MNILTVVFAILSISFAVSYCFSIYKLKQLRLNISKLMFLNTVLQNQNNLDSTDQEIHKENFIKFLSDSRDWAFTYIEDVQKGLEKFIQEVEPHIEYYDNYGSAVEGMMPPHDNALKKISKEFKELKKLLPEESNDRC